MDNTKDLSHQIRESAKKGVGTRHRVQRLWFFLKPCVCFELAGNAFQNIKEEPIFKNRGPKRAEP
jgi:hypothetical protein